MKKTEIRTLDMLRRVRQFILARIAAFPANSPGHRLYLAVGTFIGNMERCSAEQSVQVHAYGEKSAQRNVADDALRDLMETVSRTARSMSREFPGAKEKFRLPSKHDGETWLAFARDFSTEAVPFAEEFVGRGLAPDFIDDLKARILAVEEAAAAQAKAWGARVQATACLAEAAQKGRRPCANSTLSCATCTGITRRSWPRGRAPATSSAPRAAPRTRRRRRSRLLNRRPHKVERRRRRCSSTQRA